MKKILSTLLSLILLLGLLSGCGANTSVKMEAAAPMMMNSTMAGAADYAAEEALSEDGLSTSTSLPENRKWIITVYMDAETEDLDTAMTAVDARIQDMGGYVENQSVYNGSAYSGRRYRNANLTVRIPAEQVDAFTEELTGIANVVSKEKNLEDITLRYVATESRMKALQTEEARLLELLAEAENMSDLLEIEARLTDVRYELESTTTQLRLYNNQVDFATIHLTLTQVQEYTPVEEPTVWERITEGFADSLEGLKNGVVDVFVAIIVSSPYLAVFGVLLAAIIALVKKLPRKKRKAKQEPKE